MTRRRPETVRYREALCDEAIAILDAEYASELRIDDVAARLATSRRQLQRALAEIGNTTFTERLTATRMGRAAELLIREPTEVRHIAERVGYRQAAQFAKAFRRHHGVSPVEYREQRRGG